MLSKKKELDLKYMFGMLTNFKMIRKGCNCSYIYGEEILTYLEFKTKLLIKHL